MADCYCDGLPIVHLSHHLAPEHQVCDKKLTGLGDQVRSIHTYFLGRLENLKKQTNVPEHLHPTS